MTILLYGCMAYDAASTVVGAGVTVVSTTFVSSTKLTIKVKAVATAPVGNRDVTVTTGVNYQYRVTAVGN